MSRPERVWQIYQLDWPDQAVYIGQTVRPLERRLRGHRSELDSLVGKRLRAGRLPAGQILLTCLSQSEADTQELAMIAEVPPYRRLNRPTLRRRQGSPEPPVDGCYLCCWCGQWKAVKDMSPDPNRSRGVGSKCRVCHQAYGRVSHFWRRTRRDWLTPAEAYRVAYRLARRWAELGHDLSLLGTRRMRQWSRDDWDTLLEGHPRQVDDLIHYLAGLPPPPPPTWARPGTMACCGAPPETPIPSGTFTGRHYMRSRNAVPPPCAPAKACGALLKRLGYSVPVGEVGKPRERPR